MVTWSQFVANQFPFGCLGSSLAALIAVAKVLPTAPCRMRGRLDASECNCYCSGELKIENDRNPNFHYVPKPTILHFQMAEYSAETEYSAEYLIFC